MKSSECRKYPCFFYGKPKRKNGRIVWDCSSCCKAEGEINKEIIEKVIEKLRTVKGLGNQFYILSEEDRRNLLAIEKNQDVFNAGMLSVLSRACAIAFSHNTEFRKPEFPIVLLVNNGNIVGEVTDSGNKFYERVESWKYILPALPFPEAEIDGIVNVVSASPNIEGHEYLKQKIKIKGSDASLVLGFDFGDG